MTKPHRLNLLVWATLLVLGGLEFAASFLSMPAGDRPLLILPSVVMAVTVAIGFMRLLSATAVARCFAVAGIFWLAILTGLAMMDPLTRLVYAAIM
jgi:caa(3)-type oxidase subunit IV